MSKNVEEAVFYQRAHLNTVIWAIRNDLFYWQPFKFLLSFILLYSFIQFTGLTAHFPSL